MMRKVQNIKMRSHRCRSSFLSVDEAPRFVAIAPTTPTAYRSARPATSLTATTKIAGITVATINPKFGTPYRLSFKCRVIVAAEDIQLTPFLDMVSGFAVQIHGAAKIAQVHRRRHRLNPGCGYASMPPSA